MSRTKLPPRPMNTSRRKKAVGWQMKQPCAKASIGVAGGSDTFQGNGSNNTFSGLDGADAINGGGGTDYVDYRFEAGFGGALGVAVDLANGTATDSFGATDTLSSIEGVYGTNAADVLVGDAKNNYF